MKVTKNEIKNIKNYNIEKDKFYILHKIISSEDSALFSDLENYIIGQSGPNLPIWIWTKDDIEDIDELRKDLEVLMINKENRITCKTELYNLLKEIYNITDYFEMGFLSCSNVIKPLKNGIFVRPNYSDVTQLAKYWIDNEKEMDKIDISMNEAIEEADNWIKEKNFYVLKNNSGKIVCMAGYSVIDDLAKITHVYTPKEERGKGYCKNLIYNLTKKLLEEGYKPMLYTDYNYASSNKAYIGVGYENKDILINSKILK